MAMNLKGRSLLSLTDLSYEEIHHILDTAGHLKMLKKAGQPHQWLSGKTLGMIFEKPSTRTRVSFEVGMWQLGGYALYLNPNDLQLGRGETIADTARVLSRFVDGIMARTYAHKTLEDLARYCTIPVINGLSDYEHPCQILGDLLTIQEKKGDLHGLKLAYVGDGNNVAHSLIFGAVLVGMDIAIAVPEGYEPLEQVLELAAGLPSPRKCSVQVVGDPAEAAQGADALYTDVWTSMGQEKEKQERLEAFSGFQMNDLLVQKAKKDVIVLHCLPAHRGEEITDSVMDGPRSVVWDQAENRLHIQKAIMALTM
ncbi:MAG: ornithine carbamoyltransferase [Armatimonadetes bacterium]|nr:ornithine carbamoyltransferase [Armatimonadota bacterium]